MRVSIELELADIERFTQALVRSRRIAREVEETDVVDAAKHALDSLQIGSAPSYVRKRMVGVQRLIVMLEDEAWALPNPQREDVLEALVYFSDPEDLIPDGTEVIGLLDDAIMLELLLRRLARVLRAYADFCSYRESLGLLPQAPVARHAYAARLANRRDALRRRLRRRVRAS
jgi:uncharacterized membrane protein YkvA (DUF1232 family)